MVAKLSSHILINKKALYLYRVERFYFISKINQLLKKGF